MGQPTQGSSDSCPSSSRPSSGVTRSRARFSCMRRPLAVPPRAAAISAQPWPAPRRSATVALLRRQTAAQRLQQVAARGYLFGPRLGGGHQIGRVGQPAGLARVAPLPVVEAGEPGQLVLGHAHQQGDQLRRVVEVILPGGGADEEAGQHRLADVHRIEAALQGRVGQAGAHGQADGRLVAAHQLLGGRGRRRSGCVAGTRRRGRLGHGSALRPGEQARCRGGRKKQPRDTRPRSRRRPSSPPRREVFGSRHASATGRGRRPFSAAQRRSHL